MTEGKVIMFLNSCGEGGQKHTFKSSMMLLCVYFSDKFIFNSLPEIYALIITQNFLRVHLKVYHSGIPFYLSLFLSLSLSLHLSLLFSHLFHSFFILVLQLCICLKGITPLVSNHYVRVLQRLCLYH